MNKIRKLIDQLNTATAAYNQGTAIMTDMAWDTMYYELCELEKMSGLIYPDSPTQSIHYDTVNVLNKVEHSHPMLSLDKTKDLAEVEKFVKVKESIAMCKMDGLTCSLTYVDGVLARAETRGNGIVGEDILHNARVVENIPLRINHLGDLIVDGEIICPIDVFEQKFADEYSNTRNFASGSIRLLDSKESEQRNLKFVLWEVITTLEDSLGELPLSEKLTYAESLGFEVVPWAFLELTLEDAVRVLKEEAKKHYYPIDGLVFKYNDCGFGRALGATAHHANNALAYKFYDEVYETKVLDIEWSMGRSGKLTPVVICEPVEIDGAIISRANVHNFSVLRKLSDGYCQKGDIVGIYRSNQIIPQISYWKHQNTGEVIYAPTKCPYCGHDTDIETSADGVRNLICTNSNCESKLINILDHFASKKGLDIKGLSKATLEKLLEWDWINELSDIFNLHLHQDEWAKKPGFGPKSVVNILTAIDQAKETTLEKFLTAIGIPLIGPSNAKQLAEYFNTYEEFRDAVEDDTFNFFTFDGFAINKHDSIKNFNYSQADEVFHYLNITKPEVVKLDLKTASGLTFVITGSLKAFKNRSELQKEIELHGGKVSSSVSSKTNYLVNNDKNSTSAKNAAAIRLGIPIISEEELIARFL